MIDNPSLTSLQSLAHRRSVALLSLFCHYHFGFCYSEFVSLVTFSRSSRAQAELVIFIRFLMLGVVLYDFNLFPQGSQIVECSPTFCIALPPKTFHVSRTESINWFLRERSRHFPSLQYVFAPWGLILHFIFHVYYKRTARSVSITP